MSQVGCVTFLFAICNTIAYILTYQISNNSSSSTCFFQLLLAFSTFCYFRSSCFGIDPKTKTTTLLSPLFTFYTLTLFLLTSTFQVFSRNPYIKPRTPIHIMPPCDTNSPPLPAFFFFFGFSTFTLLSNSNG